MTGAAQLTAWIGDRILGLAAFHLVEETSTDKKRIFLWSGCLITNRNMNGGDKIEEEIGQIYRQKGFDASLNEAKAFLQTTPRWKEYQRLLALECEVKPAKMHLTVNVIINDFIHPRGPGRLEKQLRKREKWFEEGRGWPDALDRGK